MVMCKRSRVRNWFCICHHTNCNQVKAVETCSHVFWTALWFMIVLTHFKWCECFFSIAPRITTPALVKDFYLPCLIFNNLEAVWCTVSSKRVKCWCNPCLDIVYRCQNSGYRLWRCALFGELYQVWMYVVYTTMNHDIRS